MESVSHNINSIHQSQLKSKWNMEDQAQTDIAVQEALKPQTCDCTVSKKKNIGPVKNETDDGRKSNEHIFICPEHKTIMKHRATK